MVTYIFYCIVLVRLNIYYPLKIQKVLSGGKKYRWKSEKHQHPGMQIMIMKTMTIRIIYVHVILNGVIFPQILYDDVIKTFLFRQSFQ